MDYISKKVETTDGEVSEYEWHGKIMRGRVEMKDGSLVFIGEESED